MIQNPNVLVNNFINKEGVVVNGSVETATSFTYTGNFQYLDIDYFPAAQGGSIAIRDIGDNYGSLYPELITIIDRETGRTFNNYSLIYCTQSYRILKLRVESHNAKGVRVIANTGLNGKLCVTKGNADAGKIISSANFINLSNSAAATNDKKTFVMYKDDAYRKRYLVLKITTSESSSYELLVIDKESNSEAYNRILVQGKEALTNSIKLNYTGTRYFYIDTTDYDICSLYENAQVAQRITNLDYLYTDDKELAEALIGRNKDSKNYDRTTNDGVSNTLIDLRKVTKRWYVLYIDFVNGVSKYLAQGLRLTSATTKIYRYDMKFTGIHMLDFDALGMNSGYYFLDIDSATDRNAVISLSITNYDATHVDGLDMIITHIGEYDDISQFQKFDDLMSFGDNTFECKRIVQDGVFIHYALDDYWVIFESHNMTLNKAGKIIQLNIQDLFNWRINNDREKRAWLIHPAMVSNVDDLSTNLMLNIYDDNNDGIQVFMVCNVDNITDVLDINNWSVVKWWEKKDSARKIPVNNSVSADAHHRYDTTLPDAYYNFDEVSQDGHHIAFQGGINMSTILHFMTHGKSLTMWGLYANTGERIPAWATSDGGRNWVAVYDFVNYNNNTDNINTSAFTAYSSGLTLNKITCVNPTAEVKEPENKYTITELSGWTLNKGTSTTITFSVAHGITSNVIVAFTGNSTAEWNLLRTSELSGNTIGDNVYIAVPTNSTTLELHPYLGSYDTQLSCRHIHSINETKSGFIIGTGESYPNGWILFLEDGNPSTGTEHDAMLRDFNITRLNSTPNGLQRPCGLIMYEDSNDPTILFNSDHAMIGNMAWNIEGRTNLPRVYSTGIWKGKLSDIDDIANFECICDVGEPGIWMFRYNGIILVYYQFGGMAVSVDDGKSFRYYPYYYSYRRLTGVYQGKIILNYGYAMILK